MPGDRTRSASTVPVEGVTLTPYGARPGDLRARRAAPPPGGCNGSAAGYTMRDVLGFTGWNPSRRKAEEDRGVRRTHMDRMSERRSSRRSRLTARIDEPAIRRLTRRQIDAGMHFLVPCGTTGETPTLSREKKRRVVELVVAEAAGHVPVLAGAGGYDTHEVDRGGAGDGRRPAPTASCASPPTTTSPRRKASTSTIARSPRARRCRSSSTTCPAAPAATSNRATLVRLAADPEHRRA